MKLFISDLIEYFLVIRPEQNRIAVVSYGADVTVDLDFISRPSNITECELFAVGGQWETNVVFDSLNANAPNIEQLFTGVYYIFLRE